jgi:hypothetical protein
VTDHTRNTPDASVCWRANVLTSKCCNVQHVPTAQMLSAHACMQQITAMDTFMSYLSTLMSLPQSAGPKHPTMHATTASGSLIAIFSHRDAKLP